MEGDTEREEKEMWKIEKKYQRNKNAKLVIKKRR